MVSQQLFICLVFQIIQCLVVLLYGIATYVMVINEISSCSNVQCGFCSILHHDRMGVAFYLSICFHLNATLCFQSSLDTLLLHSIDNGCQFKNRLMIPFGDVKDISLKLTCKFHIKRQHFPLVGLQFYNDDIVCLRGKYSSFIFYAIMNVGGCRNGIAQIQIASIVTHILMPQHQFNTPHRQESHTMRAFNKVTVNKFRGFKFLTLKY